ncbi:hypothetical protein ACFW9I_30340 [[Kitasatospora] papulosa]|uniref:hypothetical protein n=1 Tax=[Kitasatospora] papulosa TaxID=1464011 RepID=UPI003685978A
MTAVAVEISPRRPLPGQTPTNGLPYLTRPVAPTLIITSVADLDDVMEAAKCSCAAGDANPH